jgi:hypothetical protein
MAKLTKLGRLFLQFVEAIFGDFLKRREQANPRAAFLGGWWSTDVTIGDFPCCRVVGCADKWLRGSILDSICREAVLRPVDEAVDQCQLTHERIGLFSPVQHDAHPDQRKLAEFTTPTLTLKTISLICAQSGT